MNQSDLIESAHAQLSVARGALASARQGGLAARTGRTVDILLGDPPDAFAARSRVQALEAEILPMLQQAAAPPVELQNALTALRAAEQQLTAALGAQHRTEG